ncbi:MAG: hypothetical protein KAG43_09440, partial [Candidatus Marithrix sp.]|nr:hypothetical protein [Candidatus Marithrix sp.]
MVKYHSKKIYIFIIISLVILALDTAFVVINYYSAKNALFVSLNSTSQHHQNAFHTVTSMAYNNMLQMTTFIAQNQKLNQLFLQGKKAVAREGGGAGADEANKVRQKLLDTIRPSWNKMMKQFKVRQLHYHLGPGSTSFLRVHKPNKYGDNMDHVRYTIVDTNKKHTPHVGFETGRVYSGLRGVTPVWTIDPETNRKVHVGALETGTSFSTIFRILNQQLNTGFAAFLTKEHVERNMWEQAIKKVFRNKKIGDYYLEAISENWMTNFVAAINITDDFISKQVQLVEKDGSFFSVSYFPLRDYRATKNTQLPAVGFILLLDDVTKKISEFHLNNKINIIYAVFGFLIVEILIFFAIKISIKKLQLIIDNQTKILSKANQQKNKLFSIIAHDLRGPFTPILGYTEIIKETSHELDKETICSYVATIHDSAKKIFDLLEMLLRWSSLQLDKVNIHRDMFNLKYVVEETLNILIPLAKKKNIHLQSNIQEINIYADRDVMKTVIRNLVSNA